MARVQVVVVGAGYAGLLAAFRAAREPRLEVTLVDPKPAFVQRIRLHERLAGGTPEEIPYARLVARSRVRFVRGRVAEIDLVRRELQVVGPAVDGRLGFDHLILAMGSRTDTATPGVSEHALRLDLPEGPGGDPLRAAAREWAAHAERGRRVLVVGAGLSGLEAATELAEAWPGLRVELLARGPLGEGRYRPAASRYLRRRLAELRIEVETGTRVVALEPGRARLADGSERPFDVAIWAGGMRPSSLPRAWGLPTDADGRVLVDPSLEVAGQPGIWVAGDVAAAPAAGGVPRLSCQAAFPMGAHVGDQLVRVVRGDAPRAFRFGFTLACVSLGRRQGLAHLLHADDSPAATYFTGWFGAFVKEAVCRMTTAVVKLEARGHRVYHWQPATPTLAQRVAEVA